MLPPIILVSILNKDQICYNKLDDFEKGKKYLLEDSGEVVRVEAGAVIFIL